MKKIIYFLLFITSLLIAVPLPAYSAEQIIDTEKSCELTLQYCDEEESFSGIDVQIFHAADVTADGKYIEKEWLLPYSVSVNEITAQSEWDKKASTLSAYISADNLKADYICKTDRNGMAIFSGIPTGLYFVQSVEVVAETKTTEFNAFWLRLPDTDENGNFSYNTTAKPKYSIHELTYDETEYKVVKHWKDDGNIRKRPDSITVEIQKDGRLVSTEYLSAENNWSYSWKAKNDGSIWKAVERDIPEEYTVLIEEKGKTIIITNMYAEKYENPPEIGSPPKTGIRMTLYPFIILLCISGALMLVLGIRLQRKNHE